VSLQNQEDELVCFKLRYGRIRRLTLIAVLLDTKVNYANFCVWWQNVNTKYNRSLIPQVVHNCYFSITSFTGCQNCQPITSAYPRRMVKGLKKCFNLFFQKQAAFSVRNFNFASFDTPRIPKIHAISALSDVNQCTNEGCYDSLAHNLCVPNVPLVALNSNTK